jgi:hypothetical protein
MYECPRADPTLVLEHLKLGKIHVAEMDQRTSEDCRGSPGSQARLLGIDLLDGDPRKPPNQLCSGIECDL